MPSNELPFRLFGEKATVIALLLDHGLLLLGYVFIVGH
jgi:hypothetical protein